MFFRDFGIFYHLDFYEPENLVKILNRSAKILGVSMDKEGATEIARRSRGTPRVTNRLLRRVRDWIEVKGVDKVTKEIADKALSSQRIDKNLGI